MDTPGTPGCPLRVAIIGAGPAGFYAAEHLLRHAGLAVSVDLFDRLPTPHGLVRHGVAPDHEKIKSVTRVFERVAEHPWFRYFGNVAFGRHLLLADLAQHYHQVCFCTGAETDRSLGIPGEELPGSHSATDFVAWYNGHPDHRHHTFDLSARTAVIVGMGNVALDVARILCRTPEELARTDIADHALEALARSQVREVILLGRRGPAEAAFTPPELRELTEMADTDLVVEASGVPRYEGSWFPPGAEPDRNVRKNVEILEEIAARPAAGRPKRIVLRFAVSPVAFLPDDGGGLGAVQLVHNILSLAPDGAVQARPTDRLETIPAGLAFRSIGYKGLPLAGLPFDAGRGVVPNDHGRVTAAGAPLPGVYVAGWIKRGPSGVIGTNKADAQETVAAMLEDARAARILHPAAPEPEAVEKLLRARQPDHFSFEDWHALDRHETAAGEPLGRPRVKLTSVETMLDVRNRAGASPRAGGVEKAGHTAGSETPARKAAARPLGLLPPLPHP